jgi:ABC-type multidrug transport system ATPase subunit
VAERESFYCALDTCKFDADLEENRNTTKYACENIKCKCIPGRFLCGEDGSVDIGEFLQESIHGPASFTSISTEGGSPLDGSVFSEPGMNDLISSIFGDKTITLQCNAGECLHETEVPGYARPIKKINTPLIAGVIAGCALFIVAVILAVWYSSRRPDGWGYIHLSEDEDEENAKLMADHKPASLSFKNISYRLKGKQILTNIQGAVHPGELLAVMGASGAGKTTFLDLLARKNKRGEVNGDFYVNGEKVLDDEFRSVIGFVDQEDTLLPTLTVHETIIDSALLRLPREMSYTAKLQRVEDVEKQLGIHHIRHQLIGSEEGSGRGISGGEKRRVGIACELVTSPSILFLDEPTSGLDAFNAFNVVECLVNLVKNYKRTVVFTIHQPRSNIVALFDNLILLARGRAVYSGPFSSCQAYFDSIGFACPPGFNIADYLVDLTMHAGTAHTPLDDENSIYSPHFSATRASSTVAIKSVPSISNSVGRSSIGSPSESLLRPKSKRKTSVKAQQDRQLFTRKRTDSHPPIPGTPKTDDDSSPPGSRMDNTYQWLRLSKQSGTPPPQLSEDLDDMPLLANGETGTDLDLLVANYLSSDVAATLHEDMSRAISSANAANGQDSSSEEANGFVSVGRVKGYHKVGLIGQFTILSRRTWRNLYRNPMLMLTHYAIAIVLAVFLGFLFYGLTDDIAGFQNRLGLFIFLLSLFGFSTLTTLYIFATERLLFVRERAKGYYSPLSYFAAKVVFDIVPLRLVPPLIMGAIVYPMTGLIPQWPEFLKFILFLVLFNLAAAGVCLFLGVVFKNGSVANLLGSLVMLFSLLFSGFLLNKNSIPPAVLWLQNVCQSNQTLPSV